MSDYQFRISLRIWHPEFDPASIAAAVGLRPVAAYQAGEPMRGSDGQLLNMVSEANYCTFELAAGERVSLAETLSGILAKLESRAEGLAALKESGGELELFIGWFIDGNGGDTFPPELLGQASRLGIALAFDVYGA
ncbi:DUF4279 domain-containing protein [Rhizobium mayense]|uniref:DUF4279 domain-containing protein n=1 Tax=Rhizobium mayense TaxID=1312184 RepID=A0ABT7JRW5_9HYPH|nr:DUF4279 domain-containing protein [Rhizobium mayense]MDL2399091.1 DUF4279 domain-containing protein [Rhizobium mayense]